MQRVEKEIERLIDEIDYEAVRELFATLGGGKRLRAKLVLKIAPQHEKAPLLGAIIELIHAASLLHDDVIDEALLRRGVPSVNATHGSKIAVMLGDILYSKAFSELLVFDKAIAKVVADSVTALSKGEMMDVELAKEFNEDAQRYLEMLYLKTATLIEASAKASAMLVGKDIESHALFGKNLGLSFQIIDDILDITSNAATLGKPAMSDYAEGKTTLPYIYLAQKLSHEERLRLLSSHAKVIDASESEWIVAQMKRYGTIEASFVLAQKLSNDAKEAVHSDDALVAILENMIQRSF